MDCLKEIEVYFFSKFTFSKKITENENEIVVQLDDLVSRVQKLRQVTCSKLIFYSFLNEKISNCS